MRYRILHVALACFVLSTVPATADEAGAPVVKAGDQVSWITNLTKAFERAKEKKRVLMICVNATQVDGGRVEPAAKGLREVVYKDLRVVKKSREFVMAYLTPQGTSADYGELRALGVEGLIVSPQHIFVHPDGDELISRHEYWPHGQGDTAVKALIKLMNDALTVYAKMIGTPANPAAPEQPDVGPAPEAPDVGADPAVGAADTKARLEWIENTLLTVKTGAPTKRKEALHLLVTEDKDGDCVDPLLAALATYEKDLEILVDAIRALGRHKLERAAEPLCEYLGHKDRSVRGNAAVSLEYIGSPTSVSTLRKKVSKEKDEDVANHMYRALGRCGAGDDKVRTLLAKKTTSAKSEKMSYGPIIGLAYFGRDPKTARVVEKTLKKVGPPAFGRRAGANLENVVKRALLVWCLGQVGDEKSAKFMNERMIKPLENAQSPFVAPIRRGYEAVAAYCLGDRGEASAVEAIMQGTVDFLRIDPFMDDMRRDRDATEFQPLGEWQGPQ